MSSIPTCKDENKKFQDVMLDDDDDDDDAGDLTISFSEAKPDRCAILMNCQCCGQRKTDKGRISGNFQPDIFS
jgi:hypothetical protein